MKYKGEKSFFYILNYWNCWVTELMKPVIKNILFILLLANMYTFYDYMLYMFVFVQQPQDYLSAAAVSWEDHCGFRSSLFRVMQLKTQKTMEGKGSAYWQPVSGAGVRCTLWCDPER